MARFNKTRVQYNLGSRTATLFTVEPMSDGTLMFFPESAPDVGLSPEFKFQKTIKISLHPSASSQGKTIKTYKIIDNDEIDQMVVVDDSEDGFLFPLFSMIRPVTNPFIKAKTNKADNILNIGSYNSLKDTLTCFVLAGDLTNVITIRNENNNQVVTSFAIGQFAISIVPILLPIASTTIGNFANYGRHKQTVNEFDRKNLGFAHREKSLSRQSFPTFLEQEIAHARRQIISNIAETCNQWPNRDMSEDVKSAECAPISLGLAPTTTDAQNV
jgi:hypothetical protein